MSKRDLFVVVADLDAENAITTLLRDRQKSLGITIDFSPQRPPKGDLLRYSGRDSGCYKAAVDLLRPPQKTHQHAILIFDHEGSGAEKTPREKIESDLELSLCKSGWSAGSASVIVIAPELEMWVWAHSPEVAEALGWRTDQQALREFLERDGMWPPASDKPNQPKEARQWKRPCGRSASRSVPGCLLNSRRGFL